jgi:hypothetical protein
VAGSENQILPGKSECFARKRRRAGRRPTEVLQRSNSAMGVSKTAYRAPLPCSPIPETVLNPAGHCQSVARCPAGPARKPAGSQRGTARSLGKDRRLQEQQFFLISHTNPKRKRGSSLHQPEAPARKFPRHTGIGSSLALRVSTQSLAVAGMANAQRSRRVLRTIRARPLFLISHTNPKRKRGSSLHQPEAPARKFPRHTGTGSSLALRVSIQSPARKLEAPFGAFWLFVPAHFF